jgi:GntR family transcriptional regulator
MLPGTIDRSDPALLHDQVAAAVRRAIAEGEALPGERLPPARDLAALLDVNTNTVLRALRRLRDEGLLEFQRGRGIRVSGGAVPRSLVLAKARELVQVARSEGYRRDEIVQLIESIT